MQYNEFAGVYTLLLTPFNEDLSIDYKTYEEYVSWQASFRPQHLFAVCGSSEMTRLSREERIKCASLAVKNSDGVPVFATGNLETEHDAEVEEIKALEQQGVAGLVFVTKGLCDRPQEQFEYLSSLAQCTGLPVILYEFPGLRPHLMDASVYGKLVETGRFHGIKDTTCLLDKIKEKIAVQGESNVLQANIPFLFDSWKAGARGVVATPTTCGADLFVKMWSEWVSGDESAAEKTYWQIINLDNAIDSGFNMSAKYLCRLRGIGFNPINREGATISLARMRSLKAYYDWAHYNGIL
ncbi:MAG: dihydrodipicolinate synthase family protein [Clostridia bacterium]|nr:dihydrodipicolinate synthase family protein [Clostridia bacterium]